ncbi:MAG: methyltransferase domain-containing protein [Proteobacteria bacterium]|nr:methyltransferase domain-containing protein [Pseudomonadota bacterium]
METTIKSNLAGRPDKLQRFARLLDLGCGTGLVGKHLAPYTDELVGVDLSPNMLEIADQKGIYTELSESDVLTYLNSAASRSFDLITAADVFVYVGALTDVFRQVARVLRPGGLFAFSIEKLGVGSFEISLSGRYKHSRAYIEDLANRFGFTQAHLEEVIIRQEFDNSIEGYLVCLET